jgi:crotonyl-CoA reductase
MLVSKNGANMKQGDVVLIWGASGGIGAYAVQYVLNGGGIPVGVVSSPEKAAILREMGCEAVIDRKAANYQFWNNDGTHNEKEWRRLGGDIRTLVGEDPDIVFEHPGRSTFAASMYVVKRGGTVVTCAATSGFMLEFDNRHFWMRLKRLVGSHFANYKEAYEANRLISKGMIHPVKLPTKFTTTCTKENLVCCAWLRKKALALMIMSCAQKLPTSSLGSVDRKL